jgi:hypothetical protein
MENVNGGGANRLRRYCATITTPARSLKSTLGSSQPDVRYGGYATLPVTKSPRLHRILATAVGVRVTLRVRTFGAVARLERLFQSSSLDRTEPALIIVWIWIFS